MIGALYHILGALGLTGAAGCAAKLTWGQHTHILYVGDSLLINGITIVVRECDEKNRPVFEVFERGEITVTNMAGAQRILDEMQQQGDSDE